MYKRVFYFGYILMLDPEKYLLPEPDGLPTRLSQEYVYEKLKALSFYLNMTNTAMRQKEWFERFYIDLQSGSGKNKVGEEIALGSPLIALASPYPSTQFRFNEKDFELKTALEQRISVSELHGRIKVYQSDVNDIVNTVCDEISALDRTAKSLRKWPTFNIAFLDPEGLELHWATVEKLASMKKMDLIINFSTRGLFGAIGAKYYQVVDKFFGTEEWRQVDRDSGSDPVKRRRNLIDFYRKNLEKFNYHIKIDPHLGGDDIAVTNSKNSQVYSLIFASKNPLGDKFWSQAAKSVKPPRIPGF